MKVLIGTRDLQSQTAQGNDLFYSLSLVTEYVNFVYFRATNPKRRVVRESTVVKRQGNVHRLTDRKDSDDEGNTWNGNSTQQM